MLCRLRRGLLCLLLALILSCALLTTALVRPLLSTTLILLCVSLLMVSNLPDRVLHSTRAAICQRSLGELEHHIRLVVGWRIGLVASVAGNDLKRNCVFRRVHIDLHGIHFVAHSKQMRRLLLAKFSPCSNPSLQRQAPGA